MNKDMNEGVRLLIERMKTNPDEFRIEEGALYSSNRWSKLLHYGMSDEKTFNKDEREALKEAFIQARRESFTADVIRTLHTEEEPIVRADWVSAGLGNGTLTTTGLSGKVLMSNGGTK